MGGLKSNRVASRFIGLATLGIALLAGTARAADENFCWWRPTSLATARPEKPDPGAAPGPAAKIESVKVLPGGVSLVTTAATFDLGWPLVCAQRLPAERDIAVLNFGHGVLLSVEQIDDYTCQMDYATACVTFLGDSVVVIKPKIEMDVSLLLMFKPDYQAQQKGAVLALDRSGGVGVSVTNDDSFISQKRPAFWGNFALSFNTTPAGLPHFVRGAKALGPDGKFAVGPKWQPDFGEVLYRLKAGQEIWVSIFPAQSPLETQAYIDAVGKQANPFEEVFPNSKDLSPEEYAAARAKKIEKMNAFDPNPGEDIRRFVSIPTFFHDAATRKEIRNNVELSAQLYRTGGTASFKQTNPFKTPLPVTLKWDAPGRKVTPAEIKLGPEPGAVAEAAFTFGPAPASAPTPRLLAIYEVTGPDGKPRTQTHVMAARVNEVTEVPRIAALKDLDAVVAALKDQKPRIVRGEGQAFTDKPAEQATPEPESLLRVAPSIGDSAAEIRLAVAGDCLAFHARVTDPRCTPEVPAWSGKEFGMAGIDLYVSAPGSTRVRQFHFQALSPKGDKNLIFNENGHKAGDPTYLCRVVPLTPSGYEIHALIPLKDCLLEPGASEFLVDVALLLKSQFRLMYTGDPVRCGYRNNRYFAKAAVTPEGKP